MRAAKVARMATIGRYKLFCSSQLPSMHLTSPSVSRQISMKAESLVAQLSGAGLLRTQGLVGGKWIDANDSRTIQVYNPATGEVIADVPCMGAKETNDAISSAYNAFQCMNFRKSIRSAKKASEASTSLS